MPRKAEYEQLLVVKVPKALKRRLERAAARRHTDMSKLTRDAIEEHLERLEHEKRFDDWLESARGSATSGMTTDEIMALTRGDD
jgi:predicted transcriptional regulator